MTQLNIVLDPPDWWGRRPPVGVTSAWGARAIFRQAGPLIDILWDRQGSTKGMTKELKDWINKVAFRKLEELVEEADLAVNSYDIVWWRDGDKVIEASPNASYGYLYITAYEVPEDQDISDEDTVHRFFFRQNPVKMGDLEAPNPNPNWLRHIWEINEKAKEAGLGAVFASPEIVRETVGGREVPVEKYPTEARVAHLPNGVLISYPRKFSPLDPLGVTG